MTDTKLSALTALTGANLAVGDKFYVDDISVTTSKSMTATELLMGLLTVSTGITDNTYDLGDATHQVKTGYFGTSLVLASAGQLQWSTDVILARDAAGVLGLRNGANNQVFRIYKTYVSGTNYNGMLIGMTSTGDVGLEIISTGASAANNYLDIKAKGGIRLNVGGAEQLLFQEAGGTLYRLSGSAFWSETDNTRDLGTSSLRFRKVYAGALVTAAITRTIATGAIAATGGYHVVDTEAAAASDDLDTISGGVDGMRLVLRAANSARDVVAKDGTGNLKLAGDCTLDNVEDTLEMISDGTNWYELCRSNNGA